MGAALAFGLIELKCVAAEAATNSISESSYLLLPRRDGDFRISSSHQHIAIKIKTPRGPRHACVLDIC